MPARKIVHHEPVTPAKGQTWHAVVELSHESFGGYTHNDGTGAINVRASSRTDAELAVHNAVKRRYPGHEYRLIRLTQSKLPS